MPVFMKVKIYFFLSSEPLDFYGCVTISEEYLTLLLNLGIRCLPIRCHLSSMALHFNCTCMWYSSNLRNKNMSEKRCDGVGAIQLTVPIGDL